MNKGYTARLEKRHREVRGLMAERNLAGAEKLCRDILNDAPRDAHAYFLLGMLDADRGRIPGALSNFRLAIQLDPTQPEYLAQTARLLIVLKADKEAIRAADAAASLNPSDALTLDTLGCVYSRAGNHHRALEHFRQATRKKPDNADFQFNMAASLKFVGSFDEAEAAYENALQANPAMHKAHWALANLRHQDANKNHIDRLITWLKTANLPVDGELHLRYALAKEYEDINQYDRAFDNWQQANTRKRSQLNYSPDEDRKIFESVQQTFNSELLHQPSAGYPTEEPIFIVGMPRTGTTLAERILSSHSGVYSAGELENLGVALKKATATRSNRILDINTVQKSARVDFSGLGSSYLQSTRPATGNNPRFIDKTPLNFFFIGLIHLALPNAKIICLRRNPMDTCLSNFRQLFALHFSYYNYAYDLMDTGKFFVLFNRLMAHWNETLPGKILNVDYEKLVSSQESESRRMVSFCGLNWEDACLDFAANTAPVATASAVQVRKPIYSSSVSRWKKYAGQLEPLKQLLESHHIAVE